MDASKAMAAMVTNSIEHAMSAYHQELPHGAGLIMISVAYYQYFIDCHVCDERFVAMAKALGKADASCAQDFVDVLVQLQKDCSVADLKMSDFGIQESELDILARNARETMGGLFGADPCELSHEQCVAIYQKSYRLIETMLPYTADFDELRDVNHNEMSNNTLPELKESNLNIAKYDTVFVGYPVWATDVPQALISFLNQYDLSGKTVIPFCTHDGYGAGDSYYTISDASKAEKTLDGLAIEAKDVLDSQNTVTEWLNSIGVSKWEISSLQSDQTAIKITIGDTVLDGVLYDTALAQEIKKQFPLTVSMVGYAGREYYGGVDFDTENLEGGQRNFENGDITYCEAHHNMAIFYAQTDNPTLSVDVIPIGRVTSDLSLFNTLDDREEITFSLAE